MIITCEECQTKFRVADELIKRTGSRVCCSNCQHVFTVFRPPSQDSVNAPDQLTLDRPEDLDRELADLFQPDETYPPEQPQPNPWPRPTPVILARPPYPAENRPLATPGNWPNQPGQANPLAQPRATQPQTPQISFSQEAGPSPDPSLGLGLDDEPVSNPARAAQAAPNSPLKESLMEPPVPTGPTMGPELSLAPNSEPLGPEPESPLEAGLSPNPAPEMDLTASLPVAPAGELPPRNLEKDSRRSRIFFLVAAVIIAFLVIGLLIMSIWRDPQTVALQTSERSVPPARAATSAPAPGAQSPANLEEPLKLNFVQDQESHHYRVNKTAGRILIITGQVTNGYLDRRSFIRLKGSLKDSRGEVVAERQVYAGNYLTEEELVNLPMPEILARLALKGGQNNSNVNVPPNKAVAFMLVFDRLPEDLAAYILEPISSTPAGQGGPS